MGVGHSRRVVVTGLGAVSPLGTDVASTWDGVTSGRNGIGPITLFDPTHWPVQIAGEVQGFDYSRVEDPSVADLTQYSRG